MKTSIYISQEKIQIIGYIGGKSSVTVKKYTEYPLHNSVINSKIVDRSNLVHALCELKKSNPNLFEDTDLILDGNSISTKRIIVPKLNKKQYYKLIKQDFFDTANNFEELVCDYQMLNKTSILACATEKSQIEEYIAVFNESGINLTSIKTGIQAVINYVTAKQELKNKVFVLNIVDKTSMLSIIFENGVSVFMSRTRLQANDEEQYVQDIADNLSKIIQFTKSENFSDITHSYYLGLDEYEMELLNEINPCPGIKMMTLNIYGNSRNAGKLPIDAHFVYLNAVMNQDFINLIQSLKLLNKMKKKKRPISALIPIFAGIAAVLLVPVCYLWFLVYNIDNKISEINEYLENPQIVQKSNEINELRTSAEQYAYTIKSLKSKLETEKSKAVVSNQILDWIVNTHSEKVTVITFNFNEKTETLRVSAKCANEKDSAAYVEALKENKHIDKINYTGYSYNTSGEYNFSIEIKVRQ